MFQKMKISQVKYILVCIVLFLTAMNYKIKFFPLAFLAFFLFFLLEQKLIINKFSFVYLMLGGWMLLCNSKLDFFSMIQGMAFGTLYLLGYNIILATEETKNSFLENAERKSYILMLVIAGGSFFHYILNYFYNLNGSVGRNTYDIWTGQSMAATGQVALACIMMGLAVAMIFAPPKKYYRYIGVVSIVLMLAYDLILACRTMIVILGILIIIGVLYLKKNYKASVRTFKVGIILTFLSLIVGVFLFNTSGFKDYITESNLFGRFDYTVESVVEDGRGNAKIAFICNAWKHPFGGMHLREKYGYAHDLLLDGYDEFGIIIFLILIIILILGIKELIKLIKYTNYKKEIKFALLCINVAILLEFCIEPILSGMSWLFACYCFINGCISGMNSLYFRKREKSK